MDGYKNNIAAARRNYEKATGSRFTQEDAAREFHISLGTYRNYEQEKSLPNAVIANEIAKKYRVSLDYLLGVEQPIMYANIKIDVEQEELVELFGKLSESDKVFLLETARRLAR